MSRSKMQTDSVPADRPVGDHSANVSLNLQRLTEEHDRLQIRTSKLQKQLSDTISEYDSRIKLLEEENGEVRGNLEFISLERNVLSEMVAELEESIKREKEVCRVDKESLQDLDSQTRTAQQALALKTEKMRALEARINEMAAELDRLRREKDDRKSLLEKLIDAWIEMDAQFMPDSSLQMAGNESFPRNEQDLIDEMRNRSIEVRNLLDENSSLKAELSTLVQDNLNMKTAMMQRTENENSKLIEARLREELRDEKERVTGLMDEMDVLKERLRCAEVVSNELKKQVKEMSAASSSSSAVTGGPGAASTGPQVQLTAPSYVNNNPQVLRQELKSVREVIAAREAMIKSLNDKYIRHRQVWEENERRANDEIKKLDEIIDRVVLTLSSCSPYISDCPPLKRLLEDLTRDQQISVTNLSSTIV